MSRDQPEDCPNCGAALDGRYCQNCGQKRIGHHDLTVKHFLSHTFHELTHLESTAIVRTLTALVFKPGKLTNEYLAGHRSRYIEPVRLYLPIAAVFFLFFWGPILHDAGSTARIEQKLAVLAQYRHADARVIAERFDHNLKTYAGWVRFASALALALFVQLLYFRSKRYYIEHLIFALHYISFYFILSSSSELLRMGLRLVHLRMPFVAGMSSPVLLVYMFVALRVVYKESRVKTFFKAVTLAIADLGLFIASITVAALVAIIALLLT